MKTLFLVFFILIFKWTYANQVVMVTSYNDNDNVFLILINGTHGTEAEEKADMLLQLSAKLLKAKGYTKEQLNIYFDYDYLNSDSSFYSLGFGQFPYWNSISEKSLSKKDAFHLVIKDRDLDIKKTLNLINSSFSNMSFVKAEQYQVMYNNNLLNDSDTLQTISPSQINNFFSISDTTIEHLINEKSFPIRFHSDFSDIDYYFQNNKYHFYSTRLNSNQYSSSQKNISIKDYNIEDIFVVDNVFQVFGNSSYGYFIFINDSIFYYYSIAKYKVTGPHEITTIWDGSRPIKIHSHEFEPIKRIVLLINNFESSNKAIFFPDSNLVVSNFQDLENNFMNELIKKELSKKDKKDSKENWNLIFVILVLSIFFIVWLFKKLIL